MTYVWLPLAGAKCQTMLTLSDFWSTPKVFGVRSAFFSGEPPARNRVGLPRMSSEVTVTWSIDSPLRSGMSR
jgi:hypothetical protein